MTLQARIDAPGIEWREGRAEALPFEDRSFVAVISQFGLMFFADRSAAIREMLRVVRPEGRLAVAVWDSLERNPAYATEVDLLERVAGRRAADAVRVPFVLGDACELRELFSDAGVASVEVATLRGAAAFPSISTMVEAAAAEEALLPFRAADGRVAFASSAHVVTGAKR
jgi:SAM-dependent methyltransferase